MARNVDHIVVDCHFPSFRLDVDGCDAVLISFNALNVVDPVFGAYSSPKPAVFAVGDGGGDGVVLSADGEVELALFEDVALVQIMVNLHGVVFENVRSLRNQMVFHRR